MDGLKVKQSPKPWIKDENGFVVDANGVDVSWYEHIDEILLAVNCHDELLEACKAYADKYFTRCQGDLERLTPEARQILNAIVKAEGRTA